MLLRWLCLIFMFACGLPAQADHIYIVQFQQGENWSAKYKYESQPGIERHLKYWQNLYLQEILLMSGPFEDQSGGLFLLRTKDRPTAEALLAGDPAVQSKLIEASIQKWRILTSAMRSMKPQLIEIDPDQSFKVERLDPDSPINLPWN